MNGKMVQSPDERRPWSGPLFTNFGKEIGTSLAGLRHEYDQMITNFEVEKQKLKSFQPEGKIILEEKNKRNSLEDERPPSPSLSGGRARGNTFSAGLKKVKRRFSSKRASAPTVTITRSNGTSPLVSGSKLDTESGSSLDHDSDIISSKDHETSSSNPAE